MSENELNVTGIREQNRRVQRRGNNQIKMALFIIAFILLVGSIISIGMGFDKYLNYYNSESYSSLSQNAYVGGDAYNYIINSGYFTAFLTLGGCLLITSSICATTAIKLDK